MVLVSRKTSWIEKVVSVAKRGERNTVNGESGIVGQERKDMDRLAASMYVETETPKRCSVGHRRIVDIPITQQAARRKGKTKVPTVSTTNVRNTCHPPLPLSPLPTKEKKTTHPQTPETKTRSLPPLPPSTSQSHNPTTHACLSQSSRYPCTRHSPQ